MSLTRVSAAFFLAGVGLTIFLTDKSICGRLAFVLADKFSLNVNPAAH